MIRWPFALFILSVSSPAWAISNGGFETGDLENWLTLGVVSVETSAFGSGPPEGNSQAFVDAKTGLSTDGTATLSEIETFLGVLPGFVKSINPTPGFFGGNDQFGGSSEPLGSAMLQAFGASGGDTITFQWNFLTSDGLYANPPGSIAANSSKDVSFMTLTGPGLLFGVTLSNTLDQPRLSGNSFNINPFLTSSTPFIIETGFRDFSFVIPNDGIYTLGFGVLNIGFVTTASPSGLLIDNVSSSPQLIPEPSTWVLLASGLIGLALWRCRMRAN